MFGITNVTNGLMAAKYEHESFEAQVASMSEELRVSARERRKVEQMKATEERRHREIVEATQKRHSNGMFGFLFGFLIGRS